MLRETTRVDACHARVIETASRVTVSIMRRVLALVAIVSVGVLGIAPTAAGAKDQNDLDGAQKAFLRYTGHIDDRQWGAMYGFLHPAQKSAIDKATFIACLDDAIPQGSGIKDVKFEHDYEETVTIPGTNVQEKSTALTVEYTATLRDDTEKAVTDIVHVFYKRGRWRFTLTKARFDDCTNRINT